MEVVAVGQNVRGGSLGPGSIWTWEDMVAEATADLWRGAVLGVAPTCSSVCTALHASRLSHSEPPSATPSPALSVESLSSEGASQPAGGDLLEPPVVPKSSSEPAVHAPGTPGTSASLSAGSSLSSSGELAQPTPDRTPQASPGLAPNMRGSSGAQPAKPCSGAAPTPLLLVGDKVPVPLPGTSSPQLQVKVSASSSSRSWPVSEWGLVSGQECLWHPSLLASYFLTDLAVSIYPFVTPFTEAQIHLSVVPSARPPVHFFTCPPAWPVGMDAFRHLLTCLSMHFSLRDPLTQPPSIRTSSCPPFCSLRPYLCQRPSQARPALRLLSGVAWA